METAPQPGPGAVGLGSGGLGASQQQELRGEQHPEEGPGPLQLWVRTDSSRG